MFTYTPGTRHSYSEVYDEATTEIEHGWQIFIQKRSDGTPTGRRSFVNNQGILCGVEIAEQMRAAATRDAAPDLAALLIEVREGAKDSELALRIDGALARAVGIRP